MLGTSVEEIAQFLHQEERLDSVRLGVGHLLWVLSGDSETDHLLIQRLSDPECSDCCSYLCLQ